MRIMWICNIPLPRINRKLGIKEVNNGAWLDGYIDELLRDKNLSLLYLFPTSSKPCVGMVDGIEFESFFHFRDKEGKKEGVRLTAFFEKKITSFQPDIIHIHGTEIPHSYFALVAAENAGLINRSVVSLQGLVYMIANHYEAMVPKRVFSRFYSIRSFLGLDPVRLALKKMKGRAYYEIKTLKKTINVIGRTDWDYACSKQINPELNYFSCNEILRKGFYNNRWSIQSCERFSIFISQSHYPLKGFHCLLKQVSALIRKYPNIMVYTTGKESLLKSKTIIEKMKESAYQKYLRKIVKSNKIENHVVVLGHLNEHEMIERYLKSHISICCSSIENSPNSVGESMILGVPTISSDVGGVKNLLTHGVDGYIYPFDEPYMIAYYIDKIFSNDDLAVSLSKQAIIHANKTHHMQNNGECLKGLYGELDRVGN